MKVGICTVPFITQDRHLELAIESYKTFVTKYETYRVAIVNNCRGFEDLEKIKEFNDSVETNGVNSLALAWNKGIDRCLSEGCDLVFLPNLDINLRPSTIDSLVEFSNPEYLVWSAIQTKNREVFEKDTFNREILSGGDYSCFMIDKTLFEKVGRFDEGFARAYFEDVDMDYRIKLSGNKSCKISDLIFFHYGSATIYSDSKVMSDNNYSFSINKTRFIGKWGGEPAHEKYIHPWNMENKDWFINYI